MLLGKIVEPNCEGGKSGKLLWDFLAGQDARSFHDGMTSLHEGTAGMEKISVTSY